MLLILLALFASPLLQAATIDKCEVKEAEGSIEVPVRDCKSGDLQHNRHPNPKNKETKKTCYTVTKLGHGDHITIYPEDQVYELPESQGELDQMINDAIRQLQGRERYAFLVIGLHYKDARNYYAYAKLSLDERRKKFIRDHEYSDDTFVKTLWAKDYPSTKKGRMKNTMRRRAAIFVAKNKNSDISGLEHGKLYNVDDLKKFIDTRIVQEYHVNYYEIVNFAVIPTLEFKKSFQSLNFED